MATTFTVTSDGFLNNLAIYSGSPSVAPTDGDTLVLGGHTVYVPYSISLASVTSTTGSKLIPVSGNVTITVTAATLTNPIKIQGSPLSVEHLSDASGDVAKGVG